MCNLISAFHDGAYLIKYNDMNCKLCDAGVTIDPIINSLRSHNSHIIFDYRYYAVSRRRRVPREVPDKHRPHSRAALKPSKHRNVTSISILSGSLVNDFVK